MLLPALHASVLRLPLCPNAKTLVLAGAAAADALAPAVAALRSSHLKRSVTSSKVEPPSFDRQMALFAVTTNTCCKQQTSDMEAPD
jgi:hypothetical protein